MNRLLMLPLAAVVAVTAGCTTSRDSYRDDYGYYDRASYNQYGRYDYNNPDPRYGGYYADNYYRQDRRYRSRELGSNDRIYRGRDGRYYCRRSDGTTGLVVGAVVGGIAGNIIAPGGSNTLGTILGAIGGAAAGAAIDSSSGSRARCQ